MTQFSEALFRSEAAALIRATIAGCGTTEENAVRLALRIVHPAHIPLKLWMQEVDAALGVKPARVEQGPQQGGLFG